AGPPGGAALAAQFFHTLNLLGHLLSVLVVWRLVRLLLARTVSRTATSPPLSRVEWAAGGGAPLFALHPIQLEAGACVTGFEDVLCGCLSCVAVWQYLRYACGKGPDGPRACEERTHAPTQSRQVEATVSGTAARGLSSPARWHYWLATGAFVLALLA